MNKWAYFSMGMMAGIIVLLTGALLMQHQSANAYAAQASSSDNGSGMILATGGSQSQVQDIVWVVHKFTPKVKSVLSAEGEQDKSLDKGERVQLMCYRVESSGRAIKLVASRDISFDEELVDYGSEKPGVLETYQSVKKVFEKQQKK